MKAIIAAMKPIRIVFALAPLCLAAASALASPPPGTQLHAKQELVRNNASEPESLDPANVEGVPASNIARDLYEGLTAANNQGQIVPGVAESWKQVNPTTWVFKLRKDALFSNGEPITAQDFVYGWQRFFSPKQASSYATTYGVFFVNGLEIASGKKPPADLGVKAIDKYTLEVKTTTPVAFLPDMLSNNQFAPVNKAVVDKYGKDWVKPGNFVGNGAFVLKEWQVNAKIVLEKNPKYWDAKNVTLTKVTLLPVEDANADIKLYQSGEHDWVYTLPPSSYDQYKASHPQDLRNTPILGLRAYAFNNTDPLLKDVRVRKALSMVLDRDVLAAKVTADGQIPAYGLIVKGVAGADVTEYDWAHWPMDKKVAEAKKLLAEAGVKPGTKIRFAYNTDVYHKKMAIFAAAEWKSKLGLETELENMEFKVLIKRRHDGEFQISRAGWYADYNDATTFYSIVQCGADQNDNKNCNKKADDLVVQANLQLDPAKRKALMTQAVKLVMDDYPLLPLLQYTVPRLVRPWVGGYSNLNPMDRYRDKDLYIIKH
jgi:oligopeptide transport system substrate-binding protein